jgi:hypothetical protein
MSLISARFISLDSTFSCIVWIDHVACKFPDFFIIYTIGYIIKYCSQTTETRFTGWGVQKFVKIFSVNSLKQDL